MEAVRVARELALRKSRKRCTESLYEFYREAWKELDPSPFFGNWHLRDTARHLQAVTFGLIPRLLINFPPRCSKSLLISVAWPAWVWAQQQDPDCPLAGPQVQFLFASYAQTLSERDSLKMRRLINSQWYQDRWGKNFGIMADKDTVRKFETTKGGYRLATSVGGSLTGEGGDILVVDDPINAKESNYETIRDAANTWWSEAMTTRLNSPVTGAKVVIMQRLHENDLSGFILDRDSDSWTHLLMPMEYDPALDTRTWIDDEVFFEDPRTEPGELLWPERFPESVVKQLKTDLGPFAAAGQLQQSPVPKGGGIIDRDWWKVWPAPSFDGSKFPGCSLIIGSVDTRYGTKKEEDGNAYDAMTVWGVFDDQRERTNAILMEAWRGRYHLCGVYPDDAKTDEERKPYWGLAEKIADTIRRRNIEILLIENKTRGGDLEVEVRRLLKHYPCQLILIEVDGNKVARLYANQALFADGRIYAPEKAWADTVITEVSQFPKSKHKDYTDTVSQALSWLRNEGILLLGTEADSENLARNTFRSSPKARYDV